MVGCGDTIRYTQTVRVIDYHTSWNAISIPPSHPVLPWFRPGPTSVRGRNLYVQRTHCGHKRTVWKRAQRWLNISKLNAPTTESVNVRPLIVLHTEDHKTLLIRDDFRSKWNFIKQRLERLSHKPGQLGASLHNLRTAETLEWSLCRCPHRGHEPSVSACGLNFTEVIPDMGLVTPAANVKHSIVMAWIGTKIQFMY